MNTMNFQELQSMWGLLVGERRAIRANGGSTFVINAEIAKLEQLMEQALLTN